MQAYRATPSPHWARGRLLALEGHRHVEARTPRAALHRAEPVVALRGHLRSRPNDDKKPSFKEEEAQTSHSPRGSTFVRYPKQRLACFCASCFSSCSRSQIMRMCCPLPLGLSLQHVDRIHVRPHEARMCSADRPEWARRVAQVRSNRRSVKHGRAKARPAWLYQTIYGSSYALPDICVCSK